MNFDRLKEEFEHRTLNNKNIITISGGCGYKYTYFDIFTNDMEHVASGYVFSFSLCSPSAGTRQDITSFE